MSRPFDGRRCVRRPECPGAPTWTGRTRQRLWDGVGSERWQRNAPDFESHPEAPFALTRPTRWCAPLEPHAELAFSGRLIGGRIDVLAHLAGTPFGDLPRFAHEHASGGVILFAETDGLTPDALHRALWTLRLAGWFDKLAGMIVGRFEGTAPAPDWDGDACPDAPAPDDRYLHREALVDVLSDVRFALVANADVGAVPPRMTLVNGALATVQCVGSGGLVTQTLV